MKGACSKPMSVGRGAMATTPYLKTLQYCIQNYKFEELLTRNLARRKIKSKHFC